MSTAALTLDAGRDQRPGLRLLTRVELRKMHDTRAGFWLLLGGVLLAVLAAVVTALTGHDQDHTLANILNNTTQAINVLVPIVGILLVTSEWSQRTAQVTFTLVPHRGRVLAAKIFASLVLAVMSFALALALSLFATALNPSSLDGAWSLDLGLAAQTLLYTAISMLVGVGLGAAILLSAPAIVASFVLPLGFTVATHVIGLDSIANWLDQNETTTDLTDHIYSPHAWARVATTLLLWLALPLAIGAWRFLRGEIR
jgi:ABC-type transport system involved in multi-copper enzyme maturation permease subunit